MKGDRERCLEAGMDGYIPKPVRAEELFAEIESVIGSPRSVDVDRGSERRSRAIVDANALSAVTGGDAELMFQLVDLFFEGCPPLLADMRSALAAEDCAALQFAAHALKGSAGSLAAERTYDAALRLEMSARAGDLSNARHDLAAVEREIEQLREALSALAERSDK
jgi:HPt (histidine-containing phosphotransfer) domain-containing protein